MNAAPPCHIAQTALTSLTGETAWDAICVGAGITSLAFGAQLVHRHPGTRILVIDKHSAPGGYATVFERPKAGAVFDCSLHKLSGMQAGGNLQRIFAELGLEAELGLTYPEDYFEACWPEGGMTLANDAEAAKQALMRRFPEEARALQDFFDEVAVHGRNGYYQFQMMDGSFEADFSELRHAHKYLKNITLAQALDARFKDSYLKEILGATGIYVGGFPEDLGYLYFLHVLYATLFKGNAYVGGTSQHLLQVLMKRILDNDGGLMLGTTVRRICTDEQDRVTGVETSRGNFSARQVFINAAPHYAIRALFDPTPQLEGVAARLERLKPSRSTTTLYLIADTDPAQLGLGSSETMIFGCTASESRASRACAAADAADEAVAELAYWQASPMEVTNYHALEPAGGRAICVNVLDAIAHWPERKSSGYKRKKQRAEATLLRRLYAAKPLLEGHIVFSEVSSPRTYERFTNNTDGAGYGAMVGTDLSGHLFHHGFPIKGVHFLSAWVAGPSYEAAFGFAEMKAKQWVA